MCTSNSLGLVSLLRSVLELLQSIDIEKVRIVDSNGLRVLVKPRGENVNIRCYYQGSIAECTEFARQISENVEIATSVGDGYKYQDKINKVVENAVLIQDVKGSMQTNKKNDVKTYLLIFYGTKDGRRQSLSRISFGENRKGDQVVHDEDQRSIKNARITKPYDSMFLTILSLDSCIVYFGMDPYRTCKRG